MTRYNYLKFLWLLLTATFSCFQDYSWDDHGYSLVNRLYTDVGNLLDEKFKTAFNLTYYTMGGRKDVDTSRFRRAIWNYIQCMFGIRYEYALFSSRVFTIPSLLSVMTVQAPQNYMYNIIWLFLEGMMIMTTAKWTSCWNVRWKHLSSLRAVTQRE